MGTVSRASLTIAAFAVGAGAIAAVAPAAQGRGATGQAAPTERARLVLSRRLPPLDGTRVRVALVDVTYGPGEASEAHTHPCAVVGYMLEGAVRMRVGTEPEAVYKAGDRFYEAPNGQHLVSANTSASEPARFLAFFTCDRDAPLSAPIHDAGR